uniref:hypothetical protein n=1 Tax=Elmerina hispida TaxID=1245649 RepID=UPI003002CCFD|nr:hypothetical protein [Elmerina hispida]
MSQFHILATFTKSFDINHDNTASGNSKKIQLIASTAVLAGSLDLNFFSHVFDRDSRNKKTVIIEISELFNKERGVLVLDEVGLNDKFKTWDQVRTTIDESGQLTYIDFQNYSYLRLDFDGFIKILLNNDSDSLNLFSGLLILN